jgi:uncharacterized repeat protein (TIGR03803 family)
MSFGRLLPASAACVVAFVLSASIGVAHAGKVHVLHAFTGKPGDGGLPQGDLLQDRGGNFYGTTVTGGSGNCNQGTGCGTVFKIAPDGTESVLFVFDGKKLGGEPRAGLIADGAGNLYGTVSSGGDPHCDLGYGCGAVFKLASDGTETIMHAFLWAEDGAFPAASLVGDKNANLFGTTAYGGTDRMCGQYFGCGTVFEIAPDGTETILHRFVGGADGAYPNARLWIDAAGDLFGTTTQGGANCNNGGCGTLFEITSGGQEKVLYTFCSWANCADGSEPNAGVIEDSAGNLYGTTTYGGNNFCPFGCGIVFELSAGGSFEVLHTFTDVAGGGADGAYPSADLTADAAGDLCGTTYAGGDDGCGGGGCGSVFEISNGGAESVLHGFNKKSLGILPKGEVLLDKTGHFFGTTFAGGARCKKEAGCGTVFEFTR